jgi:WD40 repeat protein
VPLAAGMMLKNRYRVTRFVAQGESGAVYQAWDSQMKRNCAIKEYSDTSPEFHSLFDWLAAQLFELKHPGLPEILDAFAQPGAGLYLVMEFVEGEDLRQKLLAQGGPLSESQVLPWIAQVCDALVFLHKQNPPVIHTDIKPANIRINPQGQAVLVDLGTIRAGHLSKPVSPSTEISQTGISPAVERLHQEYIPPEVDGQGQLDEQSDVYALGLTLFTLLTGRSPSEAEKTTPGFARRAGISPHISLLIERSMRRDKAIRLASIAEFRKILDEATIPRSEVQINEQLLRAAPVLSGGTTASLEAKDAPSKWKRVPWPAVLLGLSVLLVIVGAFVYQSAPVLSLATETPVSLVIAQTPQPSVSWTPDLLQTAPAQSPVVPTGAGYVETLTPGGDYSATQELPVLSPTALTTSTGFRIFSGHETGVTSVAYSPDGSLLASGSADGQIILWAAGTGELLHYLQGHTASVNSLAFSPDSLFLASGSADKTAIVWNVRSGEPNRILEEHRKPINDVAFSPNGQILVCASQDSTATLWDVQTGELLDTLVASISKDLAAGFTSLAFSPNGSLLAVGSARGTIFWDTALWAELRVVSGNSLSVAFAPDGKTVVMGSMTGGVILWNLTAGRLVRTLQAHTKPVTAVAFSADGKILASASRDGQIFLWDAATYSQLRLLEGHTDAVTDLAFSPDGKLLATASLDGKVILWAIGP